MVVAWSLGSIQGAWERGATKGFFRAVGSWVYLFSLSRLCGMWTEEESLEVGDPAGRWCWVWVVAVGD